MRRLYKVSKEAVVLLAFLASSMSPALADVIKIGPSEGKIANSISSVKIYYAGEVDREKTFSLIRSIDDANLNYPELKHIYFYLDSYGGDMDSGYAAYWAIKSSRTPITAINLATVMSSASMMFCGASERLSLKGSRFILHPARILGSDYSFQPDQLNMKERDLQGYNQMFSDIYKECTTFQRNEIDSILQSESQRAFLLSDQAIAKGIISGVAEKIIDTPVSYYITDTVQK